MNASEFGLENCIDYHILSYIDVLLGIRKEHRRSSNEIHNCIKKLNDFCNENSIYPYFENVIEAINSDSCEDDLFIQSKKLTIEMIQNNFPIMRNYLVNGKSIKNYADTMNINTDQSRYYYGRHIDIFTLTGDLAHDNISNVWKLEFGLHKQFYWRSNHISNIYKLTNLRFLYIKSSGIKSIDLSSFQLLESLNMSNNILTELDLSNNTKLTRLEVLYNRLKTINLSNNLSLDYLDLSCNQLTEINLKNNKLLKALILISNNLTEINLENNKKLCKLELQNNLLNSIDLNCLKNISILNVSSNNMKKLYLLGNNKLTILTAYSKKLKSVHIRSEQIKMMTYFHYHDNTLVIKYFA